MPRPSTLSRDLAKPWLRHRRHPADCPRGPFRRIYTANAPTHSAIYITRRTTIFAALQLRAALVVICEIKEERYSLEELFLQAVTQARADQPPALPSKGGPP